LQTKYSHSLISLIFVHKYNIKKRDEDAYQAISLQISQKKDGTTQPENIFPSLSEYIFKDKRIYLHKPD